MSESGSTTTKPVPAPEEESRKSQALGINCRM